MKVPTWIAGLIDLFSTGRRVGLALVAIGTTVILISLTASFASHAQNPYYSGPVVTVNGGTWFGAAIIGLAFIAILGDIRYAVMQREQQEVEGQQRLRSAEDKLANSLRGQITEEEEEPESAAKIRTAVADALALSVLWEVTNARLSEYHRIATTQARRSFVTAQWAIVAGFLLLVGFAVLAFHSHSAAAAFASGALGAVSAALTAYIGKTFVRSQEMSAKHLRAYFDQPLEFSRYLAAERLVSSQQDTTTEQRNILLQIILKGMVEGPLVRDLRNPQEPDQP